MSWPKELVYFKTTDTIKTPLIYFRTNVFFISCNGLEYDKSEWQTCPIEETTYIKRQPYAVDCDIVIGQVVRHNDFSAQSCLIQIRWTFIQRYSALTIQNLAWIWIYFDYALLIQEIRYPFYLWPPVFISPKQQSSQLLFLALFVGVRIFCVMPLGSNRNTGNLNTIFIRNEPLSENSCCAMTEIKI